MTHKERAERRARMRDVLGAVGETHASVAARFGVSIHTVSLAVREKVASSAIRSFDGLGVCCLLTNRKIEVLVDAEDINRLMAYSYSIKRRPYTPYCRGARDGKCTDLHRIVMDDHANQNGLDNRKANLRVCDKFQSAQNKRGFQSGAGLKGVCKIPRSDRFETVVTVAGKRHRFGPFVTPEEAHAAYREQAAKLHGEFARFE